MDEVKAYMESVGYKATGLSGYFDGTSLIHADQAERLYNAQKEAIRKTLEQVKANLPKKWGSKNIGIKGSIMWSQALGHDKAVKASNDAIDSMIKENN